MRPVAEFIEPACRVTTLRSERDYVVTIYVLDDLANPSDILRVEQVRTEEVGFNPSDLDAEFLNFGRDRQRKPFDCKLGRSIGRAVLQPDHAGDRTDVDDVSRTLPPHDRQGGLHHMHDAVKVRCELLLDLGCGHLLEITEQTRLQPALLTTMSMRPKRFNASSMAPDN